MVDNFNRFAPWFDNLSDQGDFYFVQVIQRKKECNVGSNNDIIKDYYFFDEKSFLISSISISLIKINSLLSISFLSILPQPIMLVFYSIS